MHTSVFLAISALLLGFSRATTCDDAADCDGDTITDTAYCYGYEACEDTSILNSYTYAYGYLSNYDSTIKSTYLYAQGYLAGYYSDVSSQYVYAYGYYALQYADVEPYSSYLYMYLYGLYAGYYADVSCYSGDYCYVYCGASSGCYGLDFYCYSGAYCYYDCSDSSSACPTLYSGVESDLTDDEITAIKQKQRAMKADMAENDKKHGFVAAFPVTDEEGKVVNNGLPIEQKEADAQKQQRQEEQEKSANGQQQNQGSDVNQMPLGREAPANQQQQDQSIEDGSKTLARSRIIATSEVKSSAALTTMAAFIGGVLFTLALAYLVARFRAVKSDPEYQPLVSLQD
jgi:hypothetical protein